MLPDMLTWLTTSWLTVSTTVTITTPVMRQGDRILRPTSHLPGASTGPRLSVTTVTRLEPILAVPLAVVSARVTAGFAPAGRVRAHSVRLT